MKYVNDALIQMGYIVTEEEVKRAVQAEYQKMKQSAIINTVSN